METKRVVVSGKRTGRRILVTIETQELCTCGVQLLKVLENGAVAKRCSAGAKCSAKAA